MKRTLQLSGILTATGLLIAVIFPYFVSAVFGFLLVGAGVSSVMPIIYSAAGSKVKKYCNPVLPLLPFQPLDILDFFLAPRFIGFLLHQASNLRVSLGLIAFLGAAIAFTATRSRSIRSR